MTIGPTDDELADMIGEDVRAMPDTVTILRPTQPRTSGGYGQNFQPLTTRAVSPQIQALFPNIAPGTTPGRLTASILSGGSETAGPGEQIATMAYTLTIPPGTDIKKQDRVQVTQGGQTSTFEVAAVKGAASWNLSDSVTLTEIQ